MPYYAHIRENGQLQTVEDHLTGTAERCREFASAFGEGKRGYLLGYAHDIGKYSKEFQRRLLGGAKVDHATAGALACAKQGEFFAGCCVAAVESHECIFLCIREFSFYAFFIHVCRNCIVDVKQGYCILAYHCADEFA